MGLWNTELIICLKSEYKSNVICGFQTFWKYKKTNKKKESQERKKKTILISQHRYW